MFIPFNHRGRSSTQWLTDGADRQTESTYMIQRSIWSIRYLPLSKRRTFTTHLRISSKRRKYDKENKVKSNCTWVIGYTEWQWSSWTVQGKGTYTNDCVYMTNSQLRSVITCSAANWQTLRETLSWINSIQIALLKWQLQYYHYSDTETSKKRT